MTTHKVYISNIPRTAKFVEGNYESKSFNRAKVATITLYKIREVMAKKKPFEDGNVLKECSVMAVG
jgi:hypothetical protein